ncbi:MAG: LysM peptidoglycan-binding domain-containing protein, partial [Actinobacteria bacterium]|nr:LysM peptidoglycan-binding domain-containing protein [Actinomycetota bacterium]
MFGQDDFSSDFSSDFTGDKAQSETDDTAFVRRNDTGNDEYDFWAHEPTRAIERITARRPRTAHAETGPRRHGNTREIPLSGNRKAATKPFDADTGLGGQSPAAARRAHAFGPDSNPLLRRVGAMVLLLAFGVPVAMAMRGDDSGRSAFALGTQAAIAAAAAAESTTVASAAAAAPAAVVAAEPAAAEAQVAVPAEAPVTATAPACQKTYTVVVGDGWLRIANKHQVTMQELLAANAATVS